MIQKLLFIAVLSFVMQAQGGISPVNILIQNSSFETPATFHLDTGGGSCANVSWSIPGWQNSAGSGIAQPNTPFPSGCWPWTVPDGKTVAYVGSGGVISQDLGVRPLDYQADPAHPGQSGYAIDGTYTLKVSITNYFGVYPGPFEARLDFVGKPGTQNLCHPYFWVAQPFQEITAVCPSPRYLVVDQWLDIPGAPPADPDAHIVLSFEGDGWPVLLDNVSLSFKAN